jgi:hypothetical protein
LDEYIDANVVPGIESKAEYLARRFDQLLPFFVPNRAPAARYDNELENARAVPDEDPIQANRRLNRSADWHAAWMGRMTFLFRDALKWRISLEKTHSADYRFTIAPHMSEYKRDHAYPSLDKPSPMDNNPDARILLTMMPACEVRVWEGVFQDRTGLEWRPIYDGKVLVGAVD